MSTAKKLTFSALIAALSVLALAVGALLPRVTLSMAALAGLFPAAVVIVCGHGWAAGSAAVAAILALLILPDKTAGIWFACFFGHYPIWKALIEAFQTRKGKPWMGWLLKLLGFAACICLLWFVFVSFFTAALPAGIFESGYGRIVLLIVLPIAFIVYDIAFSILIGWFRIKVLPKLK